MVVACTSTDCTPNLTISQGRAIIAAGAGRLPMTWRLQRTRTSAKLQATGSRSHTQLAHGALLGRLRQDPRNPRVPGSPAVTGPRGPWCCRWSRDGRHPPNSILPVAGTEAAVAAHGPHPARPPPAPADPQGSDHRLPGLVSNTG